VDVTDVLRKGVEGTSIAVVQTPSLEEDREVLQQLWAKEEGVLCDEQRSSSCLLNHGVQSFCLESQSVTVGETLECVARHRRAEVETVDQFVDLARVLSEGDASIVAVEMASAHTQREIDWINDRCVDLFRAVVEDTSLWWTVSNLLEV
jgi:hypothetical protein